MSRQILSTLIGKTVKQAARLRGGGSALPGLVIEKIDPGFIARTLAQVPVLANSVPAAAVIQKMRALFNEPMLFYQ